MKRSNIVLLVSLLLILSAVGLANAETNLALNTEVRYSTSIETFGWHADYLTDGILVADEENVIRGWSSTIRYFNPAVARENSTQWFKIDLTDVHTISRVDLVPRSEPGEEGKYFPIDFVIQVSTDPSVWDQEDESDEGWTTVVSEVDYPRPWDGAVQSFTFDPVEAQYVRVKATYLESNGDGFVFQLVEIEVY